MRNHGHEDSRIPAAEVERRRVDAIVYREYLDSGYVTPNMAPLISRDMAEPRWDRRIPATVLYAEPGERLYIHVRNDDIEPHSFHVHGLAYGIDSDGSWPFGVVDGAGRRSDAICPGEEWCYVFDVTEETVGCWPFHDHVMDIQAAVDRGLFGGVVVREPDAHIDVEVPFFLHHLAASGGLPAFDSGTLNGGDTFTHTFNQLGTFDYLCRLHPMLGKVRVNATGPATASVAILDSPARFQPDDVTIAVGGTVVWTHAGVAPHTVSDAQTSPLDTYAINGRAYVGNTPTIVVGNGERIRWYVFNLDLGQNWHNFHTHGQRFRVGTETMDTRSLGPAESFVVDTIAPPVVLDAAACCGRHHDHSDHAHPGHRRSDHGDSDHGHGDGHDDHDDESEPNGHGQKDRRFCLIGDFLVHCHVEMHMMMGMAARVRAVQQIHVSEDEAARLCFELPIADPAYCRLLGHDHSDEGSDNDSGDDSEHSDQGRLRGPGHGGGHGHSGALGLADDCPDVDPHPCHRAGEGHWERLADLDMFVVHAAVLHTGKVLLWAGTAEVGDPLVSRLWDPATDQRTGQTYGEDLFCSGHAFLPDGRLCVGGGAPIGSMRSTYIFDPGPETWTKVADMLEARWYPTLLTLPDGRILAVSGSGASQVEVYDAAADTWTLVAGATRSFPELYPSLHLLPSGQIFYSRCGWAMADTADTRTAYLQLTGPAAGSWTPLGQQQFDDRQEGTAVLQIDTTAGQPTSRVYVIGGGVSGAATVRNPQTTEEIDLTAISPTTAWATPAGTMAHPRTNVNAVLLPDGTIFIVGGQRAGKWSADPQPVLDGEIFDPAAGTFTLTPPMGFARQYHSIAVLLPDGRVLCAGGIDPANPVERDQRQLEVFSPAYLDRGPRPAITNAPGAAAYNSTVTIDTPDTVEVGSVVLIRPGSVTHHTDAGHRWIKLSILATGATSLDIRMPANGNIAPPGHYMLFLVNNDGVPSTARFVRIS